MDQQTNNPVIQGPEKSGAAGPIIAVVVILAVVLVGALYFWGQRTQDAVMEQNVESIEEQSASDETSSIEADLNSTDVDNIDAELTY